MTSLEDLNPRVKEHIDLIISEGSKKARPSKIIDLTRNKVITTKR